MSLKLQVHGGVADVGREAWDTLALPTGDPFVTYDFLHACEASGSAVPQQGWAARHLTLHSADGRLIGAMPLYLKGHSQGEYVFDHSWADAYERAGGRYYPKLLSAIPFTPATGPRLLVAEGEDTLTVRQGLIQGAVMLCEQMNLSSIHINFPPEDEWQMMGDHGLLLREDMQFIWRNQGWTTFDDFLGALSASRRKTIRRERREAQEGLNIRVLNGPAITEAHWDAFFAFYMDTGDRKWGRPYLSRDYFTRIGQTMADKVALVMAFDSDTPVAGALNFIGRDALYGRQWGTLVDKPFLHFELCYYQAIDFALKHGLSRVEAGAQGEHKIARGYLPERVRSAHYIADAGLSDAVAHYLKRERPAIAGEREAMALELSPYKSR